MEPANIAMATMKVATKLIGIKASSLLWFIGGAAVTLGLSNIGGSKNSQHVYELRMYQVNEGKMDALIARFGDHTDAIFSRHNMKSIGFLASGRRAIFAEPLCVHSRAPEPRGGPEELGCIPGRSGMEKGKGRL